MPSSQVRRTITIANGASLSSEIKITEETITGIVMPSAWTAANITFAAAASEGGTFVPVYDAAGTELEVTAAASRFIAISPDALRAARYLKVRSGTSGSAVNQAAERSIVLVLEETRGS